MSEVDLKHLDRQAQCSGPRACIRERVDLLPLVLLGPRNVAGLSPAQDAAERAGSLAGGGRHADRGHGSAAPVVHHHRLSLPEHQGARVAVDGRAGGRVLHAHDFAFFLPWAWLVPLGRSWRGCDRQVVHDASTAEERMSIIIFSSAVTAFTLAARPDRASSTAFTARRNGMRLCRRWHAPAGAAISAL